MQRLGSNGRIYRRHESLDKVTLKWLMCIAHTHTGLPLSFAETTLELEHVAMHIHAIH